MTASDTIVHNNIVLCRILNCTCSEKLCSAGTPQCFREDGLSPCSVVIALAISHFKPCCLTTAWLRKTGDAAVTLGRLCKRVLTLLNTISVALYTEEMGLSIRSRLKRLHNFLLSKDNECCLCRWSFVVLFRVRLNGIREAISWTCHSESQWFNLYQCETGFTILWNRWQMSKPLLTLSDHCCPCIE